MIRRTSIACLLLVLVGCAGAPRSRPGDALSLAAQAQREAVLGGQQRWQLQGRIALSMGDDGGSGRLVWQHDGGDFSIRVSAPVSRQSWRLSTHAGWARLEGLDDGPREGPDARVLLRDSLGWDVPLAALSAWVRGMRADGPAQVQFDDRGLPAVIEQQGWRVEFRGWSNDGPMPMPRRVFASRDEARVRLVIDAWQHDPARATVLP